MLSSLKEPCQLIINVTNRCNLFCSYCMNRDERKNKAIFLDIPRAFIYITEYFNFCRKNNFESDIYLGGCESTVHPNFKELVKFIYNKKPNIFTLTTNGRLCTDTYHMFTSVHVSNHMTDIKEEKNKIDQLLQLGVPLIFNYVYHYNDEYIIHINDFINKRARIKVFENIFEKNNKEYLDRYTNLINKLNVKRSSNDLPPNKKICVIYNKSFMWYK